jgi:hypothetical protein
VQGIFSFCAVSILFYEILRIIMTWDF